MAAETAAVGVTAAAAPREVRLLAARSLNLSEDETRLLGKASDPRAPDYPYGERGQTPRDRRISGGRF
jgi:hypothetical protein